MTAGWSLNFEKSGDYGVIIMTNPVTYESFPHKEPFYNWCKENAAALLSDPTFGGELRHRQFFIITEVYKTPRCSITYWKGTNNSMQIQLSAEAWNAGKVTGGGYWGKSTNIGTWRGYGFYVDEDNDNRVCFFFFFIFFYRII